MGQEKKSQKRERGAFKKRTVEERIYKGLGVRAFKYRIPETGDRDMREAKKKHIVPSQRKTLKDYKEFNRSAFRAHVQDIIVFRAPLTLLIAGFGFLGLYYSMLVLATLFLTLAAVAALFTIVADIYPLMTQRYNYLRMKRLGLWKEG
ncbi:MAG: hypothetical protein AAB573_00440 [Patescibacteria group bacterium]